MQLHITVSIIVGHTVDELKSFAQSKSLLRKKRISSPRSIRITCFVAETKRSSCLMLVRPHLLFFSASALFIRACIFRFNSARTQLRINLSVSQLSRARIARSLCPQALACHHMESVFT